MSEVHYDDLDHHLSQTSDIAKASMPMGMLLAWCTNMQMLSADVMTAQESLITRIKLQDALGSELLVALGGTLTASLFNRQGQQYMQDHYGDFMTVFADTFGSACYDVEDNWCNYQRLAKVLTRRYLGPVTKPKTKLWASFAKWWQR